MLPDDYDLPAYEGPTVAFVIRYHPAREEHALLFARRLFAELDYRIAALTLTPVEDDVFDVDLDGEQIHAFAASLSEPAAARATALAWEKLREKEGKAA